MIDYDSGSYDFLHAQFIQAKSATALEMARWCC